MGAKARAWDLRPRLGTQGHPRPWLGTYGHDVGPTAKSSAPVPRVGVPKRVLGQSRRIAVHFGAPRVSLWRGRPPTVTS